MAAFATYSLTPASNTSLGAISIAEGCAAANVNDAIRAVLTEGRQLYDIVNGISTGSLMPKSGGTFTGSITRSGAGAYPYFASSSLTGGAIYVQTAATALPSSPAEGTIVMQY